MLRASSLQEIQLLFGRLFSTSVRYTPPGYNSLHTTRAVFITFCAAKNSLFPHHHLKENSAPPPEAPHRPS